MDKEYVMRVAATIRKTLPRGSADLSERLGLL